MFGRPLSPFVIATLVMTAPSPAWAQGASPKGAVGTVAGADANAWSGNIRVSDDTLAALLSDGVKRSRTLRALTDRLTASDVIVYIRPDVTARSNTQARMTFLSASGGYRYLVIHMPAGPSRQHQTAILGQELQHVTAVADARSVVDSESLVREFERIGTVRQSANGRVSFESPGDAETRRRILQELADDGKPATVASAAGSR